MSAAADLLSVLGSGFAGLCTFRALVLPGALWPVLSIQESALDSLRVEVRPQLSDTEEKMACGSRIARQMNAD